MSRASRPPLLSEPRTLLRAFCEKHGIRRLEIFGSAARGDTAADSDVDMLVTLDETRPHTLLPTCLRWRAKPRNSLASPSISCCADPWNNRRTALPANIFSPRPSVSMQADQLGRWRDIWNAARLIASYASQGRDRGAICRQHREAGRDYPSPRSHRRGHRASERRDPAGHP